MNLSWISPAALALVVALATTASAQTPPWHEAMDAYIQEQVEEANLSAAAVAVVSSDEVLYARSLGETRLTGGTPVGPDTAFEIGSLTKSMTALAVLRLHEEGALELDAPVRTYLPWFRVADEAASDAITIRHLLSHSSGLPTVSHGVVWQDFDRIDPSIQQGVRALSGVTLNRAPGEAFEYANMGYATLGAVIEAVTGDSWASYVERTIFEPLEMEDSAADIEGRDGLAMAEHYTWRLGRPAAVPALSRFTSPAGSLNVSSASDMGRYLQAWLSPSESGVVSPEIAAEAFRGHLPAGTGEDVGLGWVVAELHGERLIYHTGGTAGATSNMALLPERDLGLIVLTNSMSAPAPAIGRGMLDVLLGAEPASAGPNVGRMTSRVLTVVSGVMVALLILLIARVAKRATSAVPPRRRWVLWLRAVLLTGVAAVVWILLPGVLTATGLPAPFGVRGYPFDVALAALALFTVPAAWALYALTTLFAALRPTRIAVPPRRAAATD